MSMGLPPNDPAPATPRAQAATPVPVPAEVAIASLKESGETDPQALARLAYRALTGVEPELPAPQSPMAILPGFPPFASEVLMRALIGPEERRPTAQALMIVLETVPAVSWPTATAAHLGLVEEPAQEPEQAPVGEPDAVTEHSADARVVVPVKEPTQRAGNDDAFRSLLRPSTRIPQFDPLTDPWDTDTDSPAIQAPLLEPEPTPTPSPESADRPLSARLARAATRPPDPEEPRGMHEEFRDLVSPRRQPDVKPVATPVTQPVTQPTVRPIAEQKVAEEPASAPAMDAAQPMHAEFRDLVAPTRAVPRFEPLDRAGALPVPRPRRRRGTSRAQTVTTYGGEGEGRQVLMLAAIVLVLVVLGIVYAATRDSDAGASEDNPQGASRSSTQLRL